MNCELTELHNREVGEIVKRIITPTLAAGGGMKDVMVLTESVLLGVLLTGVKLGGDDKVLDVLIAGVRKRLAELRLGHLPAEGHA